ncbi:MAG TPA: mechanosensitive ion channel family protein [Burkholderiales bacterium]
MDEKIFNYAMAWGPKALVAVLMLAAGYFVGGWAARMASRNLQRYELEPPIRQLVENLTRLLVLGLFAIMALQNLGVELMPLIAGLGVAGAAIALALQGVLGNMAAGLTIIFSKPFRVGDFISIVGVYGEVLDIRLSSTTLGHADLSRVVIPNRKIVGEILHNYGRVRQLAIEVSVPVDSDVEEALEIARSVLRANPRVLKDPAAGVGIAKIADTGVTLSIAPWVSVADYGAAGGEINQAILAAYRNRKMLRPASAYVALAGERLAVR